MKVLVTGSEGGIGRRLVPYLRAAGYGVRTFDRLATSREDDREDHQVGDLRDLAAVQRATEGTEAVLHLGALASDEPGQEAETLEINAGGTWNVLLSCVRAGCGRVVYFSSINALGNVGGHAPARRLPIDDAYAPHPLTPYQLSKHLGEGCCRAFAARHGLTALCLRPTLVTYPEVHYPEWRAQAPETRIAWGRLEYWAYVDVRDVCDAALQALRVAGPSFETFLLAADDTFAGRPTAEIVAQHYPDTPWQEDLEQYVAAQPYRSLVPSARAREVLGWRPLHSWHEAADPTQHRAVQVERSSS